MAAAKGRHVVIVQFLKWLDDAGYQQRLEPEIKLFRFEKSDCNFMELPPDRQEEEVRNIRNGLNFAKKVLTTGECDLLILDELLGLLDNSIVSEDEVRSVLEARGEDTDVILTGVSLSSKMLELADSVSMIEKRK